MFAYMRMAIDFWPGWMTEDEFFESIKREYYSDDDIRSSIGEYTRFRDKAYSKAREVGWEGDIREGPYISGVPTADTANDGQFMIAWKQDNNGDTFIVSPYPLPWLRDYD